MRFMTMVRGPENMGPPPAALIEAITKLGEEAAAKGVLVETGGLVPSAMGGARIRVSGGKVSVTDGPFSETKELVGGYAVYETQTREEAVEWCERFMALHAEHWEDWEGETELRQVFGPDDFPS